MSFLFKKLLNNDEKEHYMKQILFIFLFALVGVLTIGSTTHTPAPPLSHAQAKVLIVKALGTPILFRHYIPLRKTMCWGADIRSFQRKELIYYVDDREDIYNFFLKINSEYAQWYMGQDENGCKLKLYDIVFSGITGIATNPSTNVATVRFSLKATNISPFARCLVNVKIGCTERKYIPFDLDTPINGEMTFRKFDTGWQLDGQMANMSKEKRLSVVINQNGGN